MDDQTLVSLRAAFELSPDNAELLGLLLRAYLERGEAERGVMLLERVPEQKLAGEELRLLAARVSLSGGSPSRALALADGETADAMMVRARALFALERRDEAQRAY